MTTPRLRRAVLAVTATTVLTLTGCGGEGRTDSTSSGLSASPTESESAATVAVTIAGSEVTPMAKTVELGVGETLTLDITSDRAGELHVHLTPEKQLNVEPGKQTLELEFDQPGSVDIEEHESGALILRVLVK